MFETCRTWRKRLTLYSEGSLPLNHQPRLLLHLAHCSQCQKAMEADEALRDFHSKSHFGGASGGTSEFERSVLERLSAPLPAITRFLNRIRSSAQYVQQLLSGAIIAAALTGFCFFVTLHAPPQRTKTRLSETPLMSQSVHHEPPLPLSTLLQSPTPRAAMLWTPPTRVESEQRKAEEQRKAKRKPPVRSGANHDRQHIIS